MSAEKKWIVGFNIDTGKYVPTRPMRWETGTERFTYSDCKMICDVKNRGGI